MNLENSVFHQGNGSSNDSTRNLESVDNNYTFQQGNGSGSNNSTMNMEIFMFLRGNGVSNNGDHPRIPVTPERPYMNGVPNNGDHPRIPVTPERPYMQRSPHPRLIQRQQGYQNNNWSEPVNQVFSPEVPVMQRSNPPSSGMRINQIPFDIGHLTEESVQQQLHFVLAQMQRNQIMQSANRQVQPRNNHGVLLDNQSMQQSLNPRPSEMQGNQIMQSANKQMQPRNSQGVFLDNQSMQSLNPRPSEMQGNQSMQPANWQMQPRNNQGVLLDNQSMQSLNPGPSEMQGNQSMQSAIWQVPPHSNHGELLDNQSMQSLNPRPSEMQGNQFMQSANRQMQPRNNQGVSLGNQSMQSLNPRSSEMLGNQCMQSANWQVPPRSNHGVLLDNQSMQSLNPRPSEMQGNQIGNGWQQSFGLLNSSSPKQISQTPDTVSTQMQGNQAKNSDWLETLGLYTSILHESPTRLVKDDRLGVNGCVPQNTDSHVNNYGRDLSIGNVQWQADMRGAENAQGSFADGEQYLGHCSIGMLPAANSSYSHIENNWGQQNCDTSNQWQQERVSGMNQTIGTSSLEKNPNDGFHIPFQPLYDHATPSHVEYAAASSTTVCFNNAPVTPEKNYQSRFGQLSATENSYAVESWNPEKDKQDVLRNIREGDGTYSNQPSTVAIASPSNSTSLKEKVPEDGALGITDSNKTPQQKPPKRKKHRPKVVREGKTKRPPKPSPSKTEVAGDKSTGKRKYVRRKGLETPTPQDNEKGGFESPESGSATRSCRKELRFDSEQKAQVEPQEINKSFYVHGSHLELNSQETIPSTGLNCVSVVPAAKKDQQNTDGVGKLQSINSWNLISAANQRIANEVPRRDLKAQLSTGMDHANVKNIQTQNGMPYQVYEKDEQSQENHVYLETEQMSIQELAWATYKTELQQLSQSGTHHISDCQEIKEKTGQKRDYIDISEQTSSQYNGGRKKTGSISEVSNLEAYKRTRLNESHRVPSSSPSVTAAAESDQWQVCRSMFNCSTETEVSANRNNREIVFTENQSRNAMVVGSSSQKSRALVAEIVNRNKMRRDTSQQKTETHVSNLLTGATYNNKMESPPQRVQATIVGNTAMTSHGNAAMKSHTVQVGSSIQEVSNKKVLPRNYNEIAYPHSSRKARGKKEEKILSNTIDDLIQRLELLGISDQHGALVPYEGHGTLVPYERFEPIRRRKPRPRVDLDSETITQWNLLMGKAENDATETGQDKEKWWENEREVFRLRVDTFIARMHLVQGDRRFSVWKGSVVDSVIGVFLTQNVSDHLSSSAFMSLAAQFPFRSATTDITSCRTSPSPWVEEPEAQIIDPDGTITFPQGTLRQPLYKQDSTASSQYFEQSSENLITTLGVHLVEDNNNGTPKDVVSSQNSSDSIILQASEDIRNSSDSEVEYQTLFPNPNQSQNRKTERTDTFQQDPILIKSPFPRPQQVDYLSCMEKNSELNISKNVGAGPFDLNVLSSEESFDPPSTSTTPLSLISDTRVAESFFPVPTGNQSMSYFNPSEVVATKIQGVFPARMNAESMSATLTSSTTKETGMPNNNTSSMGRYSAASHNVNSQQEYHSGSFQPSTNINQDQSLKTFHFETSTAMEAQRPDEAHSKQKTGNLFPTGENFGSAGSKMPNERRKKNDVNKMKEVDWDELRKQVLREGPNKERGKDKMDSMDYEDLSNADVSRISDAIRERGMNNMLAERIKAFLNRLVKDHGSIDLEWLRDVPPDKAKDYLLSIRGLGLKSVECIRLLSLHHMAFPVDTNVGRIAVRLGWVPLQPLPESLQLHLLEMYPVLESIQKYIWPRLCKLDQRTLYELHYQMITFGKVFCTKSRPNCNVCPMKAECRHFASAFASARLALPGPEEKGMVSSSIPVAPTEDCSIITDPLLLAFGDSNLGRGLGLMHFSGECEPIVEEPTTPEIFTEETSSDIEDLLSENTNEIPTIEISIEALKANVQNIIQERNLEISEGDLSKALVALNPATASIPAPKLKNVSRLRTEHHVYELPDWHPVLEGMDRREPDDPSPYLLAIWTPGETADTIQPYENNCTLRGSGRLCDDKTCFHCNSIREADSQIVRGTILIPCRTAMRGSFPLNGTYFQVNEVFADHESGMNPIAVPRDSLWNLRRRTVYFGTSVTTIFRGMPIDEIQYCFWRGFVCVRGFDRKRRAPRPLMARLHFPASKLAKNKKEGK